MTLQELKQGIDLLYEHEHLRNQSVSVLTADPSMGPSSASLIENIFPGFDWDAGRIFINTKESLIKKE